MVSLYWSQQLTDHARWRADGLAAWKDEVRGFDPRIAPVLDQIRDAEQLVLTKYRSVRMSRWHGDRVVFLGDAAHAMSPQLGQGCNLALWDAMVLADLVHAATTLPDALAAYSRARRRHLRHYQFMTRDADADVPVELAAPGLAARHLHAGRARASGRCTA